MHPVPSGPLALYMANVRAPDSAPDPPLTPLQGAVRGQVNGTDAACLTAKTPWHNSYAAYAFQKSSTKSCFLHWKDIFYKNPLLDETIYLQIHNEKCFDF